MEKMKMKANKKISFFLILSVLTLVMAGCPVFREPVEIIVKANSDQPRSSTMSRRFQGASPRGQTIVDSAVELSSKNTELFDQMMVLRQENQELMAENRRFKDRIAVLEPQLKQAKKELNEANDLLIEMRIELNNWKADILGFRNEIRNADKAQLKALLRILEVLGGEVKLASNKAEETDVSEE
jgi:chromosome segregation ATPase